MAENEGKVWATTIFPYGMADVIGWVRGSRRLHWTLAGARVEADQWVEELRIGPIRWALVDDEMLIGRNTTHFVTIQGVFLPEGEAPAGWERPASRPGV